jgi:hypothetical protein
MTASIFQFIPGGIMAYGIPVLIVMQTLPITGLTVVQIVMNTTKPIWTESIKVKSAGIPMSVLNAYAVILWGIKNKVK